LGFGYKNAIALKNKEKKLIKAMISTKYNPTNEEIVANLKSSLNKVEFNNTPKISQLTNTKMDKVIKQENTAKVSSKFKYVAPAPKPKRMLYLTEAQKRRAEESLAKQAL
jgi:GTP-binding protein EngB required for normal cell division